MHRVMKVERLYSIYKQLYKNEAADSYDMDEAWVYWTALSTAALDSELEEAEQKMIAHNL